jgi:hypothetical protein
LRHAWLPALFYPRTVLQMTQGQQLVEDVGYIPVASE